MSPVDGVDHINVYSKGATELGQLLSNFAHTPFELDGMRFESVEGWWYYIKTGEPKCRHHWGYSAKKYGQSLPTIRGQPTVEELLRAYWAKVNQNIEIRGMIRLNKLQFDHYYVYGGKRRETEYRWTGRLWDNIAAGIKSEVRTTKRP